jgi:hypothetical protein
MTAVRRQSRHANGKQETRDNRGLETSRGTVSLRGGAQFSAQVVVPEQGDSITGYKFELAPAVGVFVTEGLELNVQMAVGAGFGDLFERHLKSVGLALGIRHLFGRHRIRPFVSMAFGVDFLIPDEGQDITFLVLAPAAGVVVAVGEHAGLSLGVGAAFNVGVGDTNGTIVTVPISLLSLEVFI